jgi:hypothetical protein
METRHIRPSPEPTADIGPRTIPLTGLFSQMLGVWYPRHYVVSAIDAAEGLRALEDLLAAGFGRNGIYLRDSASVREIQRQIRAQRTPLQQAGAAFARAVSDEGVMAEEYFEEARQGASLLAVLCPESKLVDDARRVLKAHGARHLRYYGETTITDLR